MIKLFFNVYFLVWENRYSDPVSSSQMTAATEVQNVNGIVPGWML